MKVAELILLFVDNKITRTEEELGQPVNPEEMKQYGWTKIWTGTNENPVKLEGTRKTIKVTGPTSTGKIIMDTQKIAKALCGLYGVISTNALKKMEIEMNCSPEDYAKTFNRYVIYLDSSRKERYVIVQGMKSAGKNIVVYKGDSGTPLKVDSPLRSLNDAVGRIATEMIDDNAFIAYDEEEEG